MVNGSTTGLTLLVALWVFFSTEASAQQPSAIDVLRGRHPDVAWDANGAVVADVNCDGLADTIMVGYMPDRVWLGVVPGRIEGAAIPITATFSVGRHSQDSFCSTSVRIEMSPLECQNEDGPLRGCKRVAGCFGFSLVNDDCDSFHFYWDSSTKTLTWWRR